MADDFFSGLLSKPQDNRRRRGRSGPDPNSYLWAGPFAGSFYGTGIVQTPGVAINYYQQQRKKEEEERARQDPGWREGAYQFLTGAGAPGFGNPLQAVGQGLSVLGRAAEWVGEKLPSMKGFTNEAQDFFNYAAYSAPRGAADAIGGALEFASRQFGDTNYYGQPLKAKVYADGGMRQAQQAGSGVGMFLGEIADDIALTVATAGAGTALAAARGVGTVANVARGTGWLGRFAPTATQAQRLGALGASLTQNAYVGSSQLGAGEISPWQLVSQMAIDAPFDMLTAGAFGATRMSNMLGDALAGASGAAVSNLVPLAMQEGYGWQDYLAQTAIGAGIGTAIGVGTNLGGRYPQAAAAAPQSSTRLTGETPEEAFVRQQMEAQQGTATAPYLGMAERYAQGVPQAEQPAALIGQGASQFTSDAIYRGQIPKNADTETQAAMEAGIYVNDLINKVPAETLVRLLDLEIGNTAGMSPEQLKAAVMNEWVYQAANGKGIDAIEARLQQAGIGSAAGGLQTYSGYRGVQPYQTETGDQAQLGLFMPPGAAAPTEVMGAGRQAEAPEQQDFRFDVAGPRQEAVAGMPEPTAVEQPQLEFIDVDRLQRAYGDYLQYRKGSTSRQAEVIGRDENGVKTISVDADDIKTGVPPSVAKAMSGFDEKGKPVNVEGAFLGPRGRVRGADKSERVTPEVVLFRDPEDGNLYAVDGRSNLINATNRVHRKNIVRDPETGAIKRDINDKMQDAPRVYDKNTNKVEAKVIEGDAQDAIEARFSRNPELNKATTQKRAEPDAEQNAADQIAAVTTAGKSDEIQERAVAGDAPRQPNVAKRAANWYKKQVETLESELGSKMPAYKRSVTKRTYQSMKDELLQQAYAINNSSGVAISVEPGFKYGSAQEILDDIETNRRVRVGESSVPAEHPLSEGSPILSTASDNLTYDQLLQASYNINGAARSDFDFGTVDNVNDAWDKFSRLFPAQAWPAVATETRAYKLAELQDPAVPRVATAASRDISVPKDVTMTVAEQASLSTIAEVTYDAAPVSSVSLEGRAAAQVLKSITETMQKADSPNAGLKPEARYELLRKLDALAGGQATEAINIDAKKRGSFFESIAGMAGMLPGELQLAVKAGQTDFGPLKAVEVSTKKISGKDYTTAKFQLDVEAIRKTTSIESVRDQLKIGNSADDNAERMALRSFESEVDEVAQSVKLDVSEASLLQEISNLSGSGRPVSLRGQVEARDKMNSQINREMRDSYGTVVDAAVMDTGLRPAAVRMYMLKYAGVSLDEDTAKRLSEAADNLMTAQEQKQLGDWITQLYRTGSPDIKQAFTSFTYAVGEAGSVGLKSVRNAAEIITGIDLSLDDIARRTNISKDVLLNLLDEEMVPTREASSVDMDMARERLNQDRAIHDAFELAVEDFKRIKSYSLVRDIKAAKAESNEGKSVKARNNQNIIASVVGGGTWYFMDNEIQDFEDDELYMGIPGSTWKKFGGGGGYAAAMLGFTFSGRNVVAPKASSTWGRRLSGARDLYKAAVVGDYPALQKMSKADRESYFRTKATERMMRKGVDPTKNPEQLDAETQAGVNAYYYYGGDASIGKPVSFVSGLVTLSKISPAFKDVISNVRSDIALKVKKTYEMTEEISNKVLAMNKTDRQAKYIDAMNEFNWRMNAVGNMEANQFEGALSVKSVEWDNLREQVRQDIQEKYFKDDPDGYAEYLSLQESLNKLREEDVIYHVGKSVKVPDNTDIDSFKAQLVAEKELAIAKLGSLTDELEVAQANYGVAKDAFARAKLAEMNRLGFDMEQLDKYVIDGGQLSKEYLEAFASQSGAKSDVDGKLKEIAQTNQLRDDIRKRIKQIEDIPRLVANSIRDGYLPRPRNGKAKYILRVQAEDVGINVRLEIDDASEVARQKIDILREVAVRRAAGKYSELYTGERGYMAEDVTPESVMTMSEEDLIKALFDSGKIYYSSYDQRTSGKRVTASKEARKIIAEAIELIDSGAGAYSTLRDNTSSIIEAKGRKADAFLEDLVNALDEITDESVDQASVKKALLESGVFKELLYNNKPAYQVNLGEVGRLVKRFLTPPNPNLTRRKNVEGYYNSDWTPQEKQFYFGQQIETMRYNITEGTARNLMKGSIDRFLSGADQYDVYNPAVQYVRTMRDRLAGVDYADNTITELVNAERVARQFISTSTLTGNVPAALFNRLIGMANLYAAAGQASRTVYGARKFNQAGEMVEDRLFGNKLEADEFLRKQGYGEYDVRDVKQEFKPGEWVPHTTYSLLPKYGASLTNRLMMMMAPATYMKWKASTNPIWSSIYDEIQKRDLQDATFTGSMAQSKLGQSDLARSSKKVAYALSQWAERTNNMASLAVFADIAMRQYGIAPADFMAMSAAQQQEMIMRLAGLTFGGRKMAADKAMLDGDVAVADEVRKYAIEKLLNVAETGRGDTQGRYSKMDITQMESLISSLPIAGELSKTFLAPMMRATDLSIGMSYGVVKQQGGLFNKDTVKAFVPLIAGYAAMMTLLGAERTPFAGDMALAASIAYDMLTGFSSEEERKKRSYKQYWEDKIGSLFESVGASYDAGKKFTRIFFTEGAIRYFTNRSVGYEGSVISGLTPAGPSFVASFGREAIRTFNDLGEKDLGEALYRHKRMVFGTAGTRLIDAATQGIQNTKLDNFGNPVIDPRTGQPMKFNWVDAMLSGAFGKTYSDVRTASAKYEDSVPLYTNYDKMNYMRNNVVGAKFIRFGGGDKKFEDRLVMAMYPEAESIDRDIAKTMSSEKVRHGIKLGKQAVDDLLAYDKPLAPGGLTIKDIEVQIQTRGRYDPSGRNAAKLKESLYGYVEDMYVTAATQQAMDKAYARVSAESPQIASALGSELPYQITDEDLNEAMASGNTKYGPAGVFAMLKFRKMFFDTRYLYGQ